VLFLGVIKPPNLSIVTEWCQGGSLHDYLRKHPNVSQEQRIEWIRQIAQGMMHLHLEKIIHRDLAARNVSV
jgi:B-Raf proto-oncogene serine/threonine-protein kinase